MTWGVEFSGPARRDLRRLDPQIARRVIAAVQRHAETEQGDVKRLRGSQEEHRLRVGDWRARFEYDRRTDVIRVLRVLSRSRAYRD